MGFKKIKGLLVITLLLLNACAKNSRAPVYEIWQSKKENRYYHVVKGDTLYSIAWAHGFDYRELARKNCIKDSHIQIGQTLFLSGSKLCKGKRQVVKRASKKAKVITRLPAKPYPRVELNVGPDLKASGHWVWPANGPILSKFSASSYGQNGIDIGGSLNTPIVAARDGIVVYSGEGLKSFGKLIILKHNDNDLSAYAHNSELLVTEGVKVKMGQKIALMGYSGTDRVKLHFEIRHLGKPVNPLSYLPALM